MIASSQKRVRLTPHQKVVEGLKSQVHDLKETEAKLRAEIGDLEDRAGDLLRERDRFCASLGLGSYLDTGFAYHPVYNTTAIKTPSFMEVAVHVGRRFAMADLAEKYLKLDNVKNILIEVDEHSNAIREIRTNLERPRKDS